MKRRNVAAVGSHAARPKQRHEHGQALAEFAMVLPILFILIFGLVDTARLYQSWVTMQHAAREGARYGVTGRIECASGPQTRADCIETTVRNQTGGLTNPNANLDVFVRSWQYPAYANPPTDGNPGDQCDALEVRVEYDFVPSVPMLGNLIGPVHMVARERLVNEPFGPCS